jgi:hypothetical protein
MAHLRQSRPDSGLGFSHCAGQSFSTRLSCFFPNNGRIRVGESGNRKSRLTPVSSFMLYLHGFDATPQGELLMTRHTVEVSSKVNLPHAITFGALCGAHLVT